MTPAQRTETRAGRLDWIRDSVDLVARQATEHGRRLDAAALRHRIYLAVHCRQPSAGTAGAAGTAGTAGTSGNPSRGADRAEFFAELSSRLRRVRVEVPGWSRVVAAPRPTVVESREGAEVLLGESAGLTWSGGDLRVLAPVLATPTDQPWISWIPVPEPVGHQRVRLYLNLSPGTALAAWADLVEALHGQGLALPAKIAGTRALQERADNTVVYFPDDDAPDADLLAQVTDTVLDTVGTGRLRTPSAGLSCPAGPGLGIGLGPPPAGPSAPSTVATSPGYAWSSALARAAMDSNPSEALDAVLDNLAASWSTLPAEHPAAAEGGAG